MRLFVSHPNMYERDERTITEPARTGADKIEPFLQGIWEELASGIVHIDSVMDDDERKDIDDYIKKVFESKKNANNVSIGFSVMNNDFPPGDE